MRRRIELMFWGIILAFLPADLVNATKADYLILENVGSFIASKNPSSGMGPGILAGAGHFYPDHGDMTYDISYFNLGTRVGPEVEVTQHTGGESDQWLLHEVEWSFRDPDNRDNRLGLFSGEGVRIREIDGNRILYWGLGGGAYSWISSENRVIEIKYVDLQRTKPEPLEVVSAYLALHPSTITLTDAEIKSQAHNEKWIKDEMDRRLWLGGKWMGTITNVGEDRQKKLKRVVDHLYIFLDYRDRYYGITGLNEKIQLDQKYLDRDKDAIEAKLNEYYQWWQKNKTGAINWP